MRRLQAFTMVELLVAMVLSALVISLAYSVYNRSSLSFQTAFRQYQKTGDLLQLQALFNRDCADAKTAVYDDGLVTVERPDYSIVYYTLMDSLVVREDPVITDTFRLGPYVYQVTILFGDSPLLEKLELEVPLGKLVTYKILARVDYSNRTKFQYRNYKTEKKL